MLNLDNAESRRSVEICYRTRKTLVNPIIDWAEDDVWEFLNDIAKVPHCKLYDEGLKRLGCIGCPIQGPNGMKRDFKQFPKYEQAYLKAFERMIENRPGEIITAEGKTGPEGAREIMKWWLKEK